MSDRVWYWERERHVVPRREHVHAQWVLERSQALKLSDGPPPRIRWFQEETDSQRRWREWLARKHESIAHEIFAEVPELRGCVFPNELDTIWIRCGQTDEQIEESVEHELLHRLQIKTAGVDAVMKTERDHYERAARRYGESVRDNYARVRTRTLEVEQMRQWGIKMGVAA